MNPFVALSGRQRCLGMRLTSHLLILMPWVQLRSLVAENSLLAPYSCFVSDTIGLHDLGADSFKNIYHQMDPAKFAP